MPLLSGESLLSRLKAGNRLLGDGAMGSQLMRAGISIDSLLRANCEHPDMVQRIHSEYLDAGAQLLTSNTFGVLSADSAEWDDYIAAGLALAVRGARESERDTAVLFSLVPDVVPGKVDFLGRLAKCAFDWPGTILIETCTSLRSALEAAEAVRSLDPGLLAVTCYFTAQNWMPDGTSPEEAAMELTLGGADVVGANCGDDSTDFVNIAQRMLDVVDVPLLFQPSAGLPIPGKSSAYPVTPEQFAERAQRLYDCGVAIVGGCCGTTPAHIKAGCWVWGVGGREKAQKQGIGSSYPDQDK